MSLCSVMTRCSFKTFQETISPPMTVSDAGGSSDGPQFLTLPPYMAAKPTHQLDLKSLKIRLFPLNYKQFHS
jgi:hypothetical protein